MDKTERRAVKQSRKQVLAVRKSLAGVMDNDAALRKTAEGQADALRQACAMTELGALDVETLNAGKAGIRVSALKNAGIKNIAQLHGMPLGRLTAVNGIGEQSAVKIKRMADEMYQAVLATARLRIDVKKRSPRQDELLKSLLILRNSAPPRARAQELLAGEPGLEKALKEAKPCGGALRWAFASKAKKERAAQASAYLAVLSDGPFGEEGPRAVAEYKQAAKATTKEAYSDFENNAAAYYALLESLGVSAGTAAATGLPAELIAEIEQYPLDLAHMKAKLRGYQAFGAKYILHQQKTLLGDEMGLGKTIQALAAIADLKAKGETHFLVVCPASVLVNWQRETEKHTDLPSIIIHGSDKTEELEQWKRQGGVGVTNFESMLGLGDRLGFRFGILVVDEAHFVKNPQARRTQVLTAAARNTGRILYMTGTPLENRVDEMCFLVGCLRPDISQKLAGMKTLSATGKWGAELAPVYLRRTRGDVLAELPDLIENEDWLEAAKPEMEAYRSAVRSGNFMAMRRVSWDVEPASSAKAQRLLEICDGAREEGRKVIVFSFFLDTLSKICAMLGDRALGPVTGGVSTAMRQQLIDEFTAAEAGKVLVAQVQAGGVGLNIQSASVVIFAEPQIKPSLETQAISRAYRMGQVRDVLVHRLLCANTVDEHMMTILSTKQAEFDTYAEESAVGTESLKGQSESAWMKEVIEQEQARLGESVQNETA
ncbi:MAG: DEAD/DEAH box helicase [Oscillospiraceae bacterium]|nr:DEAD/DEAH box helicase [Oscillospiraceae bacterium]